MATQNFYEYVNREWLETAKIPPEYPGWNNFLELVEGNIEKQFQILAEIQNKTDRSREEETLHKIYNTALNHFEEWNQITDSASYLEKADKYRRGEVSLKDIIVHWSEKKIGLPFSIYVESDIKDSDMNRIHMRFGGLSLPDRDYYLEEKFNDKLEMFRTHLGKFGMADNFPENVISFETRLAKITLPKAKQRHQDEYYHRTCLSDINSFWRDILIARTIDSYMDATKTVIMMDTNYLDRIIGIMENNRDEFADYLIYRFFIKHKIFMGQGTYNEFFDFYSRKLNGIQEPKPVNKRCLEMLNAWVGEMMGEIFVTKHFKEEQKVALGEMIDKILEEMRTALQNNEWMSEETKARAYKKLSTFTRKIGYPDKWEDFSKLEIGDCKNLLEITHRMDDFWRQKDLYDMIDKPVNKQKWEMTPHTVNAYYNPTQNEIVFPAGILQPPFFGGSNTRVENYGGIGAVIAHEITHGYDDEGRKYDENGDLHEWWTESDVKKFTERTVPLVQQANEYTFQGHHMNGNLTLGENIADIGGLKLSLHAMLRDPECDGDSDENIRNFFRAWARGWRGVETDASRINRLITDPHGAKDFRGNLVRNIPQFHQVFGTQPGDGMWCENMVNLW